MLRPLCCHMLHSVSIKLSEVVHNLLFLLLTLTQAFYVIRHGSTSTQRRQPLLLFSNNNDENLAFISLLIFMFASLWMSLSIQLNTSGLEG